MEEVEKKIYIPSLREVGGFVINIFSCYIYYIACALFYFAIYLILKSIYGEVELSSLFLLLNVVVIGLYFLEHKISIFQDFIRVNLILISLYYIVVHSSFLL